MAALIVGMICGVAPLAAQGLPGRRDSVLIQPPGAPIGTAPIVAPQDSAGATGGAADSAAWRRVLARLGALAGRSGKVRFATIHPHEMAVAPIEALFGPGRSLEAVHRVGALLDSVSGHTVRLFTLRPFAEKDASGRVGAYRLGFWPAEQRVARSVAYENPEGFVEVTPENLHTALSDHFELGDFVTKDEGQASVWPKYVVIRPALIDKLELVLESLEEAGVSTDHVIVMSGFRAPQYNARLVGPRRGGAAEDSRHQFGDAADIIIDADRDGRMDDLNGDGRLDQRDVNVVLAAVERVEAAYPELVGGVGTYRATGQHGPFAHIDVRGSRARWTTFGTGRSGRLARGKSCGRRSCPRVATRSARRRGAVPRSQRSSPRVAVASRKRPKRTG